MKHKLIVMVVALLIAAPVEAGVGVSAQCIDGTVEITVSMYFTPVYPTEFIGLVVERTALGSCDPGVIVNAEPIPMSTDMFVSVHQTLSEPAPSRGRYYIYRVWAVDADGDMHVPPHMGMPGLVAPVACGEAVVTRGRLIVLDYAYKTMGIIECEDRCWGVCSSGNLPVTETQFDDLLPLAVSGETVDVYGVLRFDEMPSPNCMVSISRVEIVPGDDPCGALPQQRHSWGEVKALFR